jgi:Skp family chaperone for outer membrane proteins
MVALLAIAGAAAAATAVPPPSPMVLAFGVVDMQRVTENYGQFKEMEQQFDQFKNERYARLQEQAQLAFLSDDEVKEYRDLRAVLAPTVEQSRRVTELLNRSMVRAQDVDELATLRTRTPEQQQQLDKLQQDRAQRSKELTELDTKVRDEIAARRDELSQQLDDQIRKAVREVATADKLAFVLAKDVVLNGGTDITDKLLAKLNQPTP